MNHNQKLYEFMLAMYKTTNKNIEIIKITKDKITNHIEITTTNKTRTHKKRDIYTIDNLIDSEYWKSYKHDMVLSQIYETIKNFTSWEPSMWSDAQKNAALKALENL